MNLVPKETIEVDSNYTIVICAATEEKGWRWLVDHVALPRVNWQFIYYQRVLLGRIVRKPDLTKLWSGWRTAWRARRSRADLIISQEAETTFWCALFCRLLGVYTPHVAIAFNYPTMPRGLRRLLMRKAFERVSRFDVSSSVERDLYVKYFGIPTSKLDVQLWKMGCWDPTGAKPLIEGEYVCALGQYGRDYPTLLKAIATLPEINFVLVVRPDSLNGLHIPENARVLKDIPNEDAFNIINFSRFMVLPLATSEMPTGHITLVSAMHLSKAVVVTRSSGIADYVRDGENALTYPAGDHAALAECIRNLWQKPERCEEVGVRAKAFATEHCSEQAAVAHLSGVLSDFRGRSRA